MASGGGRPPTIGDSKEVVHELVQHLYVSEGTQKMIYSISKGIYHSVVNLDTFTTVSM